MNFFGHAAVASWSSDSPAVVLGSMLPDFATMSGARIANDGAHEPAIGRGIDIHHKTDSVFHQLPVVTGLMRDLDTLLEERSCARGPRRAVAHIGVELLLVEDVEVGFGDVAEYRHDLSVRRTSPCREGVRTRHAIRPRSGFHTPDNYVGTPRSRGGSAPRRPSA